MGAGMCKCKGRLSKLGLHVLTLTAWLVLQGGGAAGRAAAAAAEGAARAGGRREGTARHAALPLVVRARAQAAQLAQLEG